MVSRAGQLCVSASQQFRYCLLYLNYKATTIFVWPFPPFGFVLFLAFVPGIFI